jgi:ATPase subunit of ABC transporter with duplicated ATPase domains
MIDIATSGLNKYYGSNHVLKGLSFEIYSGEKVGLLGVNGAGKTTLFKLISGLEPFESGTISKASGKKTGMLAQIPVFDEGDTVEDVLRSSFLETAEIYAAMKKIEGDASPSVLSRYGRLMEEYERLGGYGTDVRLDKICNGMGIDEGMKESLFSKLSGGEKTRVNLARILLMDCDILLLDEPTNHLDLISLEWLERFLRDFPGTVVVISHDRAFLDGVVTRIIEIEEGKANFYQGNYSYYAEEKARRFLSQSEQYEQQQKKIRQLEAAAKRLHAWGRQADSEALHKRAFAIEKRIERMVKVEKPVAAKTLTAGFDSGGYAAKEIAAFGSVSKSYGAKTIVHDLNLSIYRNDRIALVGANGCGKSTLLKMLMGTEPWDAGTIKVSVNVKPAYMPQIIEFEDPEASVLEILRSATGLPDERGRNILAGFHFRGADVWKKAAALSGGEKSRLKLCLMMQKGVNFLLLDEPTNHLDIASREWIENALADFSKHVSVL